jgi:hypothetical protein
VFDKAAGKELFLVRPIQWPPTRYTAYGSQLGGHEVNFPSFHHGNNYMDQWNWHVRRNDDGAAVTVGWTDPLRRQRVVVRWHLRPGEALLRAHYRFANLNSRPLGFSPWSNMFFGYADDLQYIIPASQVAPHGFNDGSLDVWPWPWPEWDETSICFWRNIPAKYNWHRRVPLCLRERRGESDPPRHGRRDWRMRHPPFARCGGDAVERRW